MSVSQIPRPELVFGLVGPVGVNLDMISEVLSADINSTVNYYSNLIHVTKIMRDVPFRYCNSAKTLLRKHCVAYSVCGQHL